MRASGAILAPFTALCLLGGVAILYAISPVLLIQLYEADAYHLLDLMARAQLALHRMPKPPLLWEF